VQFPSTGSVMLMEVAFTAPVESAVPWAVAHRPTLTAVDVADRSPVILVDAVSVIVLFVVVALPLVAVLPADRVKSRAATTIVEPDTETTDPLAMALVRAPVRLPAAPDGKPEGRAPDGRLRPDGRGPPRKPPPPNRPWHDPLVVPVTETLVALKLLALGDVPEGAIARTQSPALIALAASVTCWVNFVAEFHVTATWPVLWFCTCIVLPVTAAIWPDAAGPNAAPAFAPDALEDEPSVGVEVAAGLADDEEPPHAANVSAAPRASAQPARRWAGRTATACR